MASHGQTIVKSEILANDDSNMEVKEEPFDDSNIDDEEKYESTNQSNVYEDNSTNGEYEDIPSTSRPNSLKRSVRRPAHHEDAPSSGKRVLNVHYSSNDEVSENEINASNEIQFIAEGLAAKPVILEKSQVPKKKRRKDEALEELKNKYIATFGRPVDAKGLLKKINNMKTRLKRKKDLKKTGNKEIKLLDWEKHLLKAMEDETSCEEACVSEPLQNLVPPKRKLATDKYETDETRALTTKELHRLVLLHQYRTSVLQNEYYEKKLEIIKKAKPTNVSDGEHTQNVKI